MLPIVMRLKIVENGRKKISIFFPVIFIWLLLFALLLVLFPLVFIVALLFWKSGGKMLLFIYPLLFSMLVNMSNLTVDIESPERQSQVLIYMK